MPSPDELIPEQIFGQNIKELREKRGLTQEQLAEAVGMKDARTIRYWEAGMNTPKFSHLMALAQALGVRMKDLFDCPGL